MTMNSFLAEIYGTEANLGSIAESTEKLAQANLVSGMLASEGKKIEDLSPSELAKVASELLGKDSALAKEASAAAAAPVAAPTPPPAAAAGDLSKEAAAQADTMGRIMAHAYVQELASIQKEAGIKDIMGKAKGVADKAKGMKLTPVGKGAVGAAAVGAGAMAAKGMHSKMSKEKKAEEAVKLASEILVANGIDPTTGQVLAADEQEKLAEAQEIQAMARQLLIDKGYAVE